MEQPTPPFDLPTSPPPASATPITLDLAPFRPLPSTRRQAAQEAARAAAQRDSGRRIGTERTEPPPAPQRPRKPGESPSTPALRNAPEPRPKMPTGSLAAIADDAGGLRVIYLPPGATADELLEACGIDVGVVEFNGLDDLDWDEFDDDELAE